MKRPRPASLSTNTILAAATIAAMLTMPGRAHACGDATSNSKTSTPPHVQSVTFTNPTFGGIANTMMYNVEVTFDYYDDTGTNAVYDAKIGHNMDTWGSCPTGTWEFGDVQRVTSSDCKVTFKLYNFVPNVTNYHYKVTTGSTSLVNYCGIGGASPNTIIPKPGSGLTEPQLPDNLEDLSISSVADTDTGNLPDSTYVMLDTYDCGTSQNGYARDYFIVLDKDGEIVWYLDIAGAASSLGGSASTGWRYQSGPDRILATIDRQYLFEWDMGGDVVNSTDYDTDDCDAGTGLPPNNARGPCISHDAYKSDETDDTYVIASRMSNKTTGGGTAWDSCTPTNMRFIDDGYDVFDDGYTTTSTPSLDDTLMGTTTAYDPDSDSGPNTGTVSCATAQYWDDYFDAGKTLIDWTHVNSIAASKYGSTEVLDLSLKEWDQVVELNAGTGAFIWNFSSDANTARSDFGSISVGTGISGSGAFHGQHDVHSVAATTLLMFDNEYQSGSTGNARALRILLTPGTGGAAGTAVINASWALATADGTAALQCTGQGSAEYVPTANENVLVMCADDHVIEELTHGDGSIDVPARHISLDSDFCTGTYSPTNIRGWYRAFPLTHVGEF